MPLKQPKQSTKSTMVDKQLKQSKTPAKQSTQTKTPAKQSTQSKTPAKQSTQSKTPAKQSKQSKVPPKTPTRQIRKKMVIQADQVLEACRILARDEGIEVCISESLKGGAIAGAGAFVGGLLAGPVGIALGGTVGSIAGSRMCKQFRPLHEVINGMNPQQKRRLVEHMMRFIRELDITDAAFLISLATSPNLAGRSVLVEGLRMFTP